MDDLLVLVKTGTPRHGNDHIGPVGTDLNAFVTDIGTLQTSDRLVLCIRIIRAGSLNIVCANYRTLTRQNFPSNLIALGLMHTIRPLPIGILFQGYCIGGLATGGDTLYNS